MQNNMSLPLPWQLQAWQKLIQRWRNNSLPHGLLFTGNKGLGKHAFAAQFAKLLLCEVSKTQENPCEKCRSCELIHAGNHPDLMCLALQENSKVIKIDQVREFIATVSQTSYLGSLRVALFVDAHHLHVGAANALLKTLEEPPPNCVFILITDRYASLSPTIRSRCQTVGFSIPSQEIAQLWLANNMAENSNRELLLKLAEGAPLKALEYADEKRMEQRATVIEILRKLVEKSADPLADAAVCTKLSLAGVISDLYSIIVDIARFQQTDETAYVSNIDYVEMIKYLGRKINYDMIFNFLNKLDLIRNSDSNNLNQQLLLEDLFCTWYEYARKNN